MLYQLSHPATRSMTVFRKCMRDGLVRTQLYVNLGQNELRNILEHILNWVLLKALVWLNVWLYIFMHRHGKRKGSRTTQMRPVKSIHVSIGLFRSAKCTTSKKIDNNNNNKKLGFSFAAYNKFKIAWTEKVMTQGQDKAMVSSKSHANDYFFVSSLLHSIALGINMPQRWKLSWVKRRHALGWLQTRIDRPILLTRSV